MKKPAFITLISRHVWLSVIMLLSFAAPCFAQTKPTDLVILPNAVVKEIVLRKNAVIVDANLQGKLSSFTSSQLVFSESIPSIKSGSVLNSGPCKAAPYGFNVKVVSTAVNGKTMVVKHQPAGLSDLFDKCEFQQGDPSQRPDFSKAAQSNVSPQSIGTGGGTLQVPVNISAKITYNNGAAFLQANVKGTAWIYMYYKRTGIFGDQDDFLYAGVGLAFSDDPNNPDFLLKAGGKFEIKSPRYTNIPPLAFWVGPVWISLYNSVGVGLKIEATTEVEAGVELYGYGTVECRAEAGRPIILKTDNKFGARAIPPKFSNMSQAQTITATPFFDVQSKLYNTDQFVFYGEIGLKTGVKFNPNSDIGARIDVFPYLKGGIKGKFNRWDYNFDQTWDGPRIFYKAFIIDYPDPLGLTSNNQRIRTFKGTKGFLSSENNERTIRANRSSVGDWEKFTIHRHRDGSYSFVANNGYLINAAENGLQTALYANLGFSPDSWGIGDGAKFYIHRQRNGKYRIQGKLRYPASWWYDHGGQYGVQQYLQANDWEIR